MRNLQTQFEKLRCSKIKFEVEFLSFIISSLGALRNKSISSLSRMAGVVTKSTIGLWAKRLVVVAAIKGIFMIWVKAKPETLANNQIKLALAKLEEKYETESEDTKEINENFRSTN
jgi:hypothetical protein